MYICIYIYIYIWYPPPSGTHPFTILPGIYSVFCLFRTEPLFFLNSFLARFSICILSISSLASGDSWLSQVWQVETLNYLKSGKSFAMGPRSKIQDFLQVLGQKSWTPGSRIQDSRFPGGLGPEILDPWGSKIQDSRFLGGLGPEILEPTAGFKIQDSRFPGGLGPGPPGNLESWILDPQGVLLRVRDLKGRT